MANVSAYLRCSTRKQDLESQRRLIRDWAVRNGHELAWYEDDHTSGRKTDRSGIDALLAAAAGGTFQLVAIAELSRLGRTVGFIANTVGRLSELGVKIVLVNSGTVLDYESLEGRALTNALAMAADIEWCLISERNARGRETIRERGVKVGRKKRDVSEAAILALREKGLSVRDIARELDVSHPTIVRRLREVEQRRGPPDTSGKSVGRPPLPSPLPHS